MTEADYILAIKLERAQCINIVLTAAMTAEGEVLTALMDVARTIQAKGPEIAK